MFFLLPHALSEKDSSCSENKGCKVDSPETDIKIKNDKVAFDNLELAATLQGMIFANGMSYISCVNKECEKSLDGLVLSKGVTLKVSAGVYSFIATAYHKDGTGKVYKWESEKDPPLSHYFLNSKETNSKKLKNPNIENEISKRKVSK